tara:strand:+ start:414 stop:572 length:159 start_codon:yes stop_codon:yes gene_type:complete
MKKLFGTIKDYFMIEIILGIFVIIVVGFYLFRPTSEQEEKDLKSKNNWRGGF